jgi:hypothetical protein
VSQSLDASGRPAQTTVNAAFDVRRFSFGGEVFTDLEVRVTFPNAEAFPAGEVERLWKRMGEGIEEVFNAPGHRFAGGDRLHVTPVLVPYAEGADAHWVAELFEGPGRLMSHHRLRIDLRPRDAAHEFGHQVGLPDESRRERDPSYLLHVTGSTMGVYSAPVEAEALAEEASGAGRRQELVGSGLAQGGLRDRHLFRLEQIIGELPRSTEAVVPAAPAVQRPTAGGEPMAPDDAQVFGRPTYPGRAFRNAPAGPPAGPGA